MSAWYCTGAYTNTNMPSDHTFYVEVNFDLSSNNNNYYFDILWHIMPFFFQKAVCLMLGPKYHRDIVPLQPQKRKGWGTMEREKAEEEKNFGDSYTSPLAINYHLNVLTVQPKSFSSSFSCQFLRICLYTYIFAFHHQQDHVIMCSWLYQVTSAALTKATYT